jgi:hypothetical protein
MPNIVACPWCNSPMDVGSVAAGQVVACPSCLKSVTAPAEIILATIADIPSQPRRLNPWLPVVIAAASVAILLIMAIVVTVAWYGYHRYDIAEQDACAERYLSAFQTLFREPKPSLTVAEADYTNKCRKHYNKMADIEKEIQQRWGAGLREFLFRYYERHPWLTRLDPANIPNLMLIGRF